jgi:hypothetical protein
MPYHLRKEIQCALTTCIDLTFKIPLKYMIFYIKLFKIKKLFRVK